MNRILRKFVLPSILCIHLFAGCKKNGDDEIPYIEILSPSENSLIQLPDTVEVYAKASDNNKIVVVRAKLLNENLIGVLPSVERSFNSSEVEFLINYPFDDIQLSSGIYFLKVEASDGENVSSDFVQLNLNEIPLERKNLFVFSENSGDIVVWNSPLLSSLDQFLTFSGDLSSSAVNSNSGLLYISGSINGNLYAIAGHLGQIVWQVPNNSTTGGSYFFDLDYDENQKLIYVSTAESDIRGYNAAGILSSVVNISPGRYAKTILNLEGLLLAEIENAVGTERHLTVYNKNTGNEQSVHTLNFDVNSFTKIDNSRVLISGNQNKFGVLAIFNLSFNSLDFVNGLFDSVSIKDVSRIDNNNYLIATDSDLYIYQLNSNNPIVFAGGYSAGIIKVDLANSLAYGAEGSTLTIFDLVSGQIINVLESADSIDGLEVLYNR